jgi:hypothetical protein
LEVGDTAGLETCATPAGKVVAQAARLCVPANGSPVTVTETHGRDARATLRATFLFVCAFALNPISELNMIDLPKSALQLNPIYSKSQQHWGIRW